MESHYRHEQAGVAPNVGRDRASDFLSIARQLLVTVGGDPDGVVQQAEDSVRRLKEQHAGFRPGHTREDARRRLQNVRLRTPTPDERHRGLEAKKHDLQEQLGKALQDAIPLAVELAYVEAELADVLKLKEALQNGRDTYERTELYPETLKFVADMYKEYRVTYAQFAAMDPDERLAIAKILHRRSDLKPRSG